MKNETSTEIESKVIKLNTVHNIIILFSIFGYNIIDL